MPISANPAFIHIYGFDASSSANDELREIELKSTVKKLSQVVDDTYVEISSVRLDYQDPEPGFDRSRVKGLVAELVEIEDERYATVLEVTLEGDIFDPSGNLTGGSRASTGSSVLIKLKKLSDARSQLEAARNELQALKRTSQIAS
jgi:hypothetical protein